MVGKNTIMYIEDNADNRLLLRRVLEAEGFNIIEAASANTALQEINKNKPDLVLMDINLPETDGYSLTGQIKVIPGMEKTPIIAVTANVMKGDREKTLQAGCDGYIQKPIDVDTLAQQVSSFLNNLR